MRFIIADIPGAEVRRLYPGDDNYILAEDECDVHPCIGCMKCWIRNLPDCVIRDDFSGMVEKFRTCSELVILSKCVYGGFSPYVKNAGCRQALPGLFTESGDQGREYGVPVRHRESVCDDGLSV